jgi:hypothetical protein
MQVLEIAFGSSLVSGKVSGVQARKIARKSLGFCHQSQRPDNLDAVASRLRAIEVKQRPAMPRSARMPRIHFLSGIPWKHFWPAR